MFGLLEVEDGGAPSGITRLWRYLEGTRQPISGRRHYDPRESEPCEGVGLG